VLVVSPIRESSGLEYLPVGTMPTGMSECTTSDMYYSGASADEHAIGTLGAVHHQIPGSIRRLGSGALAQPPCTVLRKLLLAFGIRP
jgi:hypothetical protein